MCLFVAVCLFTQVVMETRDIRFPGVTGSCELLDMGAGKQIQVLHNSSTRSKPLSHFSSSIIRALKPAGRAGYLSSPMVKLSQRALLIFTQRLGGWGGGARILLFHIFQEITMLPILGGLVPQKS